MKVVAVEFGFGDENGIHVSAVVFDSSIAAVRAVLGKDVDAANKSAQEEFKKLEASGEAGADPESLAIEIVGGRTKLTCDMST